MRGFLRNWVKTTAVQLSPQRDMVYASYSSSVRTICVQLVLEYMFSIYPLSPCILDGYNMILRITVAVSYCCWWGEPEKKKKCLESPSTAPKCVCNLLWNNKSHKNARAPESTALAGHCGDMMTMMQLKIPTERHLLCILFNPPGRS